MFLNPYQKYIDELIKEYGPLEARQLTSLVNIKFRTKFRNLDIYIEQMARYNDYERIGNEKNALVGIQGMQPDYDVIRSIEVMLYFLGQVVSHRRCRDYVSIRFYLCGGNHTKEVSVIPVKKGYERRVSEYVNDKFTSDKSEVVMYLLEDKSQIKKITTNCYQRFAVIEDKGVVFYKDK